MYLGIEAELFETSPYTLGTPPTVLTVGYYTTGKLMLLDVGLLLWFALDSGAFVVFFSSTRLQV